MTTFEAPTSAVRYALIAAQNSQSLDDAAEETIIESYKKFGAVLLRGFAVDLAGFREFTKRFCIGSVHNSSPGRDLLDPENHIQTANVGSDVFPLHPELSREPWKPDVCFFWCMSPPSAGGETTICDGIEIVKQMPPAVFDAFDGQRLAYIQRAHPLELEYWLGDPSPSDEALDRPQRPCPFLFRRVGDHVIRAFARPALHKPMFSSDRAFGNFLLFARYARNMKQFPVFSDGRLVPDELVAAVKSISDQITDPIQWRQGDLLMLDNTRFMHGRNAIPNAAERRIATYFGYLKFAELDDDEMPNAPWRAPNFRPPF